MKNIIIHTTNDEVVSLKLVDKIISDIFSTKNCEVLFLKNMAHHHQEMKLDFLEDMTNLFLVRNPHQLIASFSQVIDSPTMQDIGLEKSWELFNIVKEQNPVVLDSAEILKNPRELLKKLCDKLRIEFYDDMLSWDNSTGFVKQKTSSRELPKNCQSLYIESLKYYNKLTANSIKV